MSAEDAAIVVWLRQDLRLADNPALTAASETGRPVIPLFILEPVSDWSPGAASRYWLHQSLAALAAALADCGSRLVLMRGSAAQCFERLFAQASITGVYWNRRYEPDALRTDTALKEALGERCEIRSFNARLMCEPHAIATKSGTPYRVFTPFYRALRQRVAMGAPLPQPSALVAPEQWPSSLALDELGLQPAVDWAGGIRERWGFGEAAAHARLEAFLDADAAAYADCRDNPAREAISRLSPHLAFGEISVRSVLHRLDMLAAEHRSSALDDALESWRRQLAWREFAYHLLFHFPHTVNAPLNETFNVMPWNDDADALMAWQQGRTGIPLVDAGMRELWHTGFMHNRVRMVAASFLCKHLGIHWHAGARWFWDTLVDADLANNTLGWQWVAGSGADAAPYFRVFNPHAQGSRYDADGAYVRRWIPQLAHADAADIHAPGAAGYCEPIIDLAAGRRAALARYEVVRAAR